MVDLTTLAQLQSLITASSLVLVDFWAPWCGPCQMLSPLIEEISQSYPNLVVAKVDVDQASDLASHFGVSSIPAVLILKQGQLSKTITGFRQKSDYLQALL
jgi:thioredoxin 1